MADETTQFVLGDAAVDALSGRRKRRASRRKRREEPPLTHCENCGTPLTGPYCSQCAQHAIDYRRSFGAVIADALDSFFDWDSKFLKTFAVLLVWPWRLTNDFNAGRRVRYVHPLRVYLVASIAFFLIAKLINLSPSKVIELTPEARAEVAGALEKLSAAPALTQEQRAKLDSLRARWVAPDADPQSDEERNLGTIAKRVSKLAEREQLRTKDMVKLDALLAAMPSPPPPPVIPAAAAGDAAAPAPVNEANAPGDVTIPPVPAPPATRRRPGIHFTTKGDGEGPQTPFEKWMEERVKSKIGEDGTNVQLFLGTLRSNIPTMMLCCIPIFALVLKLLYIRQRRHYVEHLVYALHIHSFAYVATVLITLIGMGAGREMPGYEALFAVPLSFLAVGMIFTSIRRVYRQGWFFSTWKFLLGGFVYLFVLAFGISITAFVTLLLP
ncbi:MAG: DUF3667 domain-containing protein [Verrucomicrobiota bacterium]|nr:DUF3667 domain-containing protein [Verrucomicrobiota bacterium]